LKKSSRFWAFFRSYSYPEHNKEFISKTYYGFLKGKRGKRNILSVRQQETYLNLCIDLTLESLNNFLDETGLRLNEIDLIITSQSPEGFISGLNREIAFNENLIVTLIS